MTGWTTSARTWVVGEVDVMAWGVLIALTIGGLVFLSFLERWRRGCGAA